MMTNIPTKPGALIAASEAQGNAARRMARRQGDTQSIADEVHLVDYQIGLGQYGFDTVVIGFLFL